VSGREGMDKEVSAWLSWRQSSCPQMSLITSAASLLPLTERSVIASNDNPMFMKKRSIWPSWLGRIRGLDCRGETWNRNTQA
jgi:hypothetical protein